MITFVIILDKYFRYYGYLHYSSILAQNFGLTFPPVTHAAFTHAYCLATLYY